MNFGFIIVLHIIDLQCLVLLTTETGLFFQMELVEMLTAIREEEPYNRNTYPSRLKSGPCSSNVWHMKSLNANLHLVPRSRRARLLTYNGTPILEIRLFKK